MKYNLLKGARCSQSSLPRQCETKYDVDDRERRCEYRVRPENGPRDKTLEGVATRLLCHLRQCDRRRGGHDEDVRDHEYRAVNGQVNTSGQTKVDGTHSSNISCKSYLAKT